MCQGWKNWKLISLSPKKRKREKQRAKYSVKGKVWVCGACSIVRQASGSYKIVLFARANVCTHYCTLHDHCARCNGGRDAPWAALTRWVGEGGGKDGKEDKMTQKSRKKNIFRKLERQHDVSSNWMGTLCRRERYEEASNGLEPMANLRLS